MKQQYKSLVILFLAIAIILIVTFLPISGLEPLGRLYLGMTVGMLVLWFSNAVPSPTTFFLLVGGTTLLVPLISDQTVVQAFSITMTAFASSGWSLLACAFFLVAIVKKSGLANRIALFILSIVGPKPKRFLIGILFAGAFLNLFLPAAMSVSALLTGIVGGIVSDYKLDMKSNLSKSIYLAVGISTIAGNVFIQTAGAPAIAVTNLINSSFGYNITYFEYMIHGFPVALLMDVFAFFLITRLFPSEFDIMPGGAEHIKQKLKDLGKWKPEEIKTGIVLLLAVLFWMTGKIHGIESATVALLAVFILLAPIIGTYSFAEIGKEVPWGTLLFCGASMGLATGLVQFGTARWLVDALVAVTHLTDMPVIVILIGTLIIMAICSCAFTVRASAVNALIPCVVILAELVAERVPGFNPVDFTLIAFYPLLFTVILPVHTPYTMIPQAAGGFEAKDLVKVQIPYVILTILSCVVLYFTYWKIFAIG